MPALRRVDVHPQAPIAWDAWACARRDEAGDVVWHRLAPTRVGDAEKLVVRARDGPEQDARRRLELRAVQRVQPAAPEPYKPDAVQSAEQSCAAADSAELTGLAVRGRPAQLPKKPAEALPTKQLATMTAELRSDVAE